MYDEYDERPEGCRRHRRIRFSWRLVAILTLFLSLVMFRVMSGSKDALNASEQPKTQTVSIVDWSVVDTATKQAVETAYMKAQRYAEAEVQVWIKELQKRIDEDFLPWWFGYFNQQSLMLKATGYWCMDTPVMEAVFGKQLSMQERLEALVEREFHARVLQPQSAQLRVEKITRKAVEIYLEALRDELNRIQVEYEVPRQEWTRYLGGLPEMILVLEGNREVGLVMKSVTVTGGAAAVRIGRSLSGRVRVLMTRRIQREFLEDGMRVGGRTVAKSAGWWIAGICLCWDLGDHIHTKAVNLPILRRCLWEYLQELQEQVLFDQRCGILTVLMEVQEGTLREEGSP